MLDEALIEQLNRGCVCPPDSAPEWRAACEYGFDMSLVGHALEMSADQRLERHQSALSLLLEVVAARQRNEARPEQ